MRPVTSSVITSAMLSPGTGDSRFGEYGAGLLATGNARQSHAAHAVALRTARRRARCGAARRRSSATSTPQHRIAARQIGIGAVGAPDGHGALASRSMYSPVV